MTPTASSQPKPSAYLHSKSHLKQMDERLIEITQIIKELKDQVEKDPTNWARTGDLQDYNLLLKEFTDRYYKRGEYAE